MDLASCSNSLSVLWEPSAVSVSWGDEVNQAITEMYLVGQGHIMSDR